MLIIFKIIWISLIYINLSYYYLKFYKTESTLILYTKLFDIFPKTSRTSLQIWMSVPDSADQIILEANSASSRASRRATKVSGRISGPSWDRRRPRRCQRDLGEVRQRLRVFSVEEESDQTDSLVSKVFITCPTFLIRNSSHIHSNCFLIYSPFFGRLRMLLKYP